MNDLTIPEPGSFKDRSTGLMVFGILTILLGLVVGLMVPLMIWGASQNPSHLSGTAGFQAMMPAVSFYSFLAIANIWLGIGSIMKRRWARALLLILSWTWLVLGGLITFFAAVALPFFMSSFPAGQENLPASAQTVVVAGMVGFCLVFLVAPSLIWLLFYRSSHVKATCESADPVRRWTDTCPLPVLAVALWMVLSSLSLVLMGLFGMAFLPLFGTFLTGVAARAILLLLAIFSGWLAWGLYRLKMSAWWLTGLLFLLYAISSALTFSLHSLAEFYSAMQISTQETAALADSPFMQNYMVACPVLLTVCAIGYLIFIQKFFVQTRPKNV